MALSNLLKLTLVKEGQLQLGNVEHTHVYLCVNICPVIMEVTSVAII